MHIYLELYEFAHGGNAIFSRKRSRYLSPLRYPAHCWPAAVPVFQMKKIGGGTSRLFLGLQKAENLSKQREKKCVGNK